MHRVLAGDGIAVITTPNLAAWFERLSLLFGFQPFSTATRLRHTMLGKLVTARTIEAVSEPSLGHIRVMTVRTLRLVLEAHGFRINRIIGTYGTAVYLPSMLRPIYVMLSRVLNVPSLAPNITVVIEKI